MVTVLVLTMRWSALSVDWAYAIVGSSAVRRSSSCRITGDLGGLCANMTEGGAPYRGDLGPMDDPAFRTAASARYISRARWDFHGPEHQRRPARRGREPRHAASLRAAQRPRPLRHPLRVWQRPLRSLLRPRRRPADGVVR